MEEPKVIEIQNEKIYEFDSYDAACKYLNIIQNQNNNKGESTNNQK